MSLEALDAVVGDGLETSHPSWPVEDVPHALRRIALAGPAATEDDFAGLLPEDLCTRIDAWERALEEEAERSADDDGAEPVRYQYDLSIPPGWRVGGFASWHATDPYPMDCHTCRTPMHLLLTVDSSEWDGGSGGWKPLEERDLLARQHATPTEVVVGRHGELTSSPASPTRTTRTAGASSSGRSEPTPTEGRRSAPHRPIPRCRSPAVDPY
ncbi:hypothetical protein ACIPYS_21030 [Kitasatospora sp. NPDC089913]|uniref:hypothetical protein n=1 Tax=Kitasatospora sp. NPDC089913 TaxID=3364080 RepID=UPI0038180610